MADEAEDKVKALTGHELTLSCRAINEGWDISDDVRSETIRRLQETILASDSTKREVVRAATALATIERLKLQAVSAAKAAIDTSPQVVYVQAPQDAKADPVREMIENANEEQLAVIAELLRKQTSGSEPATG